MNMGRAYAESVSLLILVAPASLGLVKVEPPGCRITMNGQGVERN